MTDSSTASVDRDLSLPPHDRAAEAAVIGSVLKSQASLAMVPWLKPEHFYDPRHRCIWIAIRSLDEQAKPPDYTMISAELQRLGTFEQAGGLEYLSEIDLHTPSAAHIQHYGEVVQGHWTYRHMIQTAQTFAEHAYRAVDPPATILAKWEAHLQSLRPGLPIAAQLESPADQSDRYWSELQARKDRKLAGLDTGMIALNRQTLGWQKGRLYLMGGRPGMGKSIICHQSALHVARFAGPVLYVSIEMSTSQMWDRQIAFMTGIDRKRLAIGRLTDEEWDKVSDARKVLAEVPLIIKAGGANSGDVRAWSHQVRAEYGDLAMVVVDHLQLMTDRRGGESSTNDDVGQASSNLARMSIDLDVPVLAAAQLNRDCEKRTDKRPVLSDYRDSGNVEQDAAVALAIYRDDYYNLEQAQQDQRVGIAELLLLKQRDSGDQPGTCREIVWLAQGEKYGDLIKSASDTPRTVAQQPEAPEPAPLPWG